MSASIVNAAVVRNAIVLRRSKRKAAASEMASLCSADAAGHTSLLRFFIVFLSVIDHTVLPHLTACLTTSSPCLCWFSRHTWIFLHIVAFRIGFHCGPLQWSHSLFRKPCLLLQTRSSSCASPTSRPPSITFRTSLGAPH